MNVPIFMTLKSAFSSFYMRQFPSQLHTFSSPVGQRLLLESAQDGNAESFFKTAGQFITQSWPAACGWATMAMVLNTLRIDPGYIWQGVWRWYDDRNIHGMTPETFRAGLTMAQWSETAQINGVNTLGFHARIQKTPHLRSASEDVFRACVRASCRRGAFPLVVNFHRGALKQSGIGHFAPLVAYHEQSDSVLLLDVAKFKYESCWCPLPLIYKAMSLVDDDSGLSRGFILCRKQFERYCVPQSFLCLEEYAPKNATKLIASDLIPALFSLSVESKVSTYNAAAADQSKSAQDKISEKFVENNFSEITAAFSKEPGVSEIIESFLGQIHQKIPSQTSRRIIKYLKAHQLHNKSTSSTVS